MQFSRPQIWVIGSAALLFGVPQSRALPPEKRGMAVGAALIHLPIKEAPKEAPKETPQVRAPAAT